MVVKARRSSPVGELGATSQRARDLRPDSEGGRVTIGRAGGARYALPATLLDLGATPFAASGPGRPGLLLAASIQPTVAPSCAPAGMGGGPACQRLAA